MVSGFFSIGKNRKMPSFSYFNYYFLTTTCENCDPQTLVAVSNWNLICLILC